ncbi:NHL repeat-containing protein [Spirosoma radiotolerans]|uniref:hypothetical protein n=1 Tax=Spirosoma radiotolerans TaxID=1379870 RepID=UPI000698B4CB|nr:hypothetical protein [Spirosoma radiotolerans]
MPTRTFIRFQLALVAVLSGGCGSSNQQSDSIPWVTYSVATLAKDTTLFSEAHKVGVMHDADLAEVSGLAASRNHPGYLWAEEDSGNSNQIQLISPEGQVVARFSIEGARNRDWEDIAVGPGPIPGKSYIYVADIGDNRRWRSEKVIYRFPEPSLVGKVLPFDGQITNAEAIRVYLPDGSQNAEAILLDPITRDLFLISKGAYSAVYRAAYPQSLTQSTRMTALLRIPFDHATSAAISTDGHEILIRTYEQIFHYSRRQGETIADALKRVPRRLPLAYEVQGEAISWAINGSGYYTSTEKTFTSIQFIYFYPRKK